MGMTVDQSRRDPGTAERHHLLRAKARKFGALADAHDLSVGDADRTVLDDSERVRCAGAFESRDPAVDEQPVPHAVALGEHCC